LIETRQGHPSAMKTRNSKDDSGSGSTRIARVRSSIQKSIQASLSRGLGDPRIRGLISVTDVDVAPDLGRACIKFSVVPDKYETRVLRGLQSAAGRLRADLGQSARLRKVPKLAFEIDRSLKNQAELEALVREDDIEIDSEVTDQGPAVIEKEAS
jgi:ribosome-binding factor A